MNKKSIIKMVEEISNPVLRENNIELVDIEFVKENSNYFLRIYIDKSSGITVDDCQKVSEYIGKKLDEVDPIDVSYYLEVSSPGLDRPLKRERDLERSLGKDVDVSLYKALQGKKKFSGELVSFNEDIIKITDNDIGEMEIPRNNISKIKLAIKF